MTNNIVFFSRLSKGNYLYLLFSKTQKVKIPNENPINKITLAITIKLYQRLSGLLTIGKYNNFALMAKVNDVAIILQCSFTKFYHIDFANLESGYRTNVPYAIHLF